MMEQRYRRSWFPDEQIAPERVIAALRARRAAAEVSATALPWMAAVDIGLALGAVVLPATMAPFHRAATTDGSVVNRKIPSGHRWSHPVARRDIDAALRHYETTGEVIRLPHPMARHAVYMAPLNADDARTVMEAWVEMEEAREDARHAQRVRRIALGRRLLGGGA